MSAYSDVRWSPNSPTRFNPKCGIATPQVIYREKLREKKKAERKRRKK